MTCRSRTSTSTSTIATSARGEGFHETFLEQHTDAGRRPSFATIGSALLWAPFYAAADLLTRVCGRGRRRLLAALRRGGRLRLGLLRLRRHPPLDRRGPADRRSGPRRRHRRLARHAAALLHVRVAALLARVLGVRRRALRRRSGCTCGNDGRVGGAVALGLSGALMAMVREQDVFLALGPAVDFARTCLESLRDSSFERGPTPAQRRDFARRSAEPLARLGMRSARRFAAIGLLPQLLAYKALNGHFGPSTLVTRKMNWQAPHALEVLALARARLLPVDAARGARARGARRAGGSRTGARRAASRACALLMVALQIYVSGSVESWTVAGRSASAGSSR